MTRRSAHIWLLFAASTIVLASAGLRAHGGHIHTIMGTIKALDATRVDVVTTDEKTHVQKPVAIGLTAKTRYLRGTVVVQRSELVLGERAVVSVGDGKPPLKATEIRVGAR